MQSWCEKSDSTADKDEVFVVDFEVSAESYDVNEQQIRVVLSTRRLLCYPSVRNHVWCNAMHGFPVLITATTNRNRVFHPFVLSVMTDKTAKDFEFIFRAIHKVHLDWAPTVLLADGANTITKAFTTIFGEPLVRLMCNYHVMLNVKKYLKPLSKCMANELKEDIRTLQTCVNEDMFWKRHWFSRNMVKTL